MANSALAPTLVKELLLEIQYFEDGRYFFDTSRFEFYAESDDDYPHCPDLDSTNKPDVS